MSIVIHVNTTNRQRLARLVPRQACFPLGVPQWIPDRLNKAAQTKHSLSNSIRSFLAVKRQEVTGLVK